MLPVTERQPVIATYFEKKIQVLVILQPLCDSFFPLAISTHFFQAFQLLMLKLCESLVLAQGSGFRCSTCDVSGSPIDPSA